MRGPYVVTAIGSMTSRSRVLPVASTITSSTTTPSTLAARAASVYVPAQRRCGSGILVASCAAAGAAPPCGEPAVGPGAPAVAVLSSVLPDGPIGSPACEEELIATPNFGLPVAPGTGFVEEGSGVVAAGFGAGGFGVSGTGCGVGSTIGGGGSGATGGGGNAAGGRAVDGLESDAGR